MSGSRSCSLIVLCALVCGCAGASDPAGTTAPTVLTDSEEILDRSPQTRQAVVLHVLIGWDALAPAYGPRMDDRGRARSKADADRLAVEILDRARGGEEFPAMMKQHSEDWTSAETGKTYTATPGARLQEPFKNLSLRLRKDEVGIVETVYGWHIIKRIE